MTRHTYLCAPRWGDLDRFAHVNNVHFLAYLEQARVDLLFHHAGEEGVTTLAEGIVVARHEIDYLRPVAYRHRPLRIDLWCGEVAGASFTVRYELFDGDDLAVRASSLLVPYNLAAGRLRRLTGEEREFLRRYLDEQAA